MLMQYSFSSAIGNYVDVVDAVFVDVVYFNSAVEVDPRPATIDRVVNPKAIY